MIYIGSWWGAIPLAIPVLALLLEVLVNRGKTKSEWIPAGAVLMVPVSAFWCIRSLQSEKIGYTALFFGILTFFLWIVVEWIVKTLREGKKDSSV